MLEFTTACSTAPRVSRGFAWLALIGWLLISTASESLAQRPPYLLQMIRDSAIHQELGLDENQIEGVEAAIAQVDPTWWVSRLEEPAKQQVTVAGLTERLQSDLEAVLTDRQVKRLAQLKRQVHGTRSLIDPDMVAGLGLSDGQVATLRERFAQTEEIKTEQARLVTEEETDAGQAARKIKAAEIKEREAINAVLTREQIAKLPSLVGQTFDFSTVKRTYPKAPNWITTSEDWIGEAPPPIADLEGNVVAGRLHHIRYFWRFVWLLVGLIRLRK